MTGPDLVLWRRHCEKNPATEVAIPAEQLLDELADRRRRLDSLREHLERRHGCRRDCWGKEGPT